MGIFETSYSSVQQWRVNLLHAFKKQLYLSESWHKEGIASFFRNPVMDEEMMKPGVVFSVFCCCYLGDRTLKNP